MLRPAPPTKPAEGVGKGAGIVQILVCGGPRRVSSQYHKHTIKRVGDRRLPGKKTFRSRSYIIPGNRSTLSQISQNKTKRINKQANERVAVLTAQCPHRNINNLRVLFRVADMLAEVECLLASRNPLPFVRLNRRVRTAKNKFRRQSNRAYFFPGSRPKIVNSSPRKEKITLPFPIQQRPPPLPHTHQFISSWHPACTQTWTTTSQRPQNVGINGTHRAGLEPQHRTV